MDRLRRTTFTHDLEMRSLATVVRPRKRKPRAWDRPLSTTAELRDLVAISAGASEEGVTVRRIPPSRSTKSYLCPGCQQQIAPGTSHVVVVPTDDPDLRRHWHTPCWRLRERRKPGR